MKVVKKCWTGIKVITINVISRSQVVFVYKCHPSKRQPLPSYHSWPPCINVSPLCSLCCQTAQKVLSPALLAWFLCIASGRLWLCYRPWAHPQRGFAVGIIQLCRLHANVIQGTYSVQAVIITGACFSVIDSIFRRITHMNIPSDGEEPVSGHDLRKIFHM